MIGGDDNCGCFNTQPPEGGCLPKLLGAFKTEVSTHSRPKAAAPISVISKDSIAVSTHSRPKAAANVYRAFYKHKRVSTHSRPKAAANLL